MDSSPLGSSRSSGCVRPHQAPGRARAGGSVPQDGHRPNWARSLAPRPQPKHPWPGNRELKRETCSKSTLFCSGRVSAPSSPLLSYLPLMCSLHPPSLPSLFHSFLRRRCSAPAPQTSLQREQSHAEFEGLDPHRRLGVPNALFLQWHPKLILHCCSTLREDEGMLALLC